MVTAQDLYNRICSETAQVLKLAPERTDIKFFVYLDETTYHEILRDLKASAEGKYDFTKIWDEESSKFMEHRLFVVKKTSFHFNVVPVI